MARVTLPGYRCERCGHEWLPRGQGQEPRVCPKCKSPYWNTPRKTHPSELQARRIKKLIGHPKDAKAHAKR